MYEPSLFINKLKIPTPTLSNNMCRRTLSLVNLSNGDSICMLHQSSTYSQTLWYSPGALVATPSAIGRLLIALLTNTYHSVNRLPRSNGDDRYSSDPIPDRGVGNVHRLIAFLKRYGQIYNIYASSYFTPHCKMYCLASHSAIII